MPLIGGSRRRGWPKQLSVLYDRGWGVKQDSQEARRLFRLAADQEQGSRQRKS
jgi:TPR repeat protein